MWVVELAALYCQLNWNAREVRERSQFLRPVVE
jgi:hypothetical protein